MKLTLVAALVLMAAGVGALVGSGDSGPKKDAAHVLAAPTASSATPAHVASTADKTAPVPDNNAELEAARARIAALEAQVHDLRVALDAAEESRVQREREFLRFTEGISHLGVLAGGVAPTFATQVPATEHAADAAPVATSAAPADPAAAKPATDVAHDATVDVLAQALSPDTPVAAPIVDANRSNAIHLNLRALFAAEQVQGIDLLESGNLQNGFVGPIVMRELDAYGRPFGSIAADRLRLEASRAARMVTIVLEQGCERRDGISTPFAGGPADANGRAGQRRIVLSDCDPRAWIESMPELFPKGAQDESLDDGRVDLPKLRAEINMLLHEEAGAGVDSTAGSRIAGDSYRLQGMGGVQGCVLRDVALDQFDRDNHLVRRLFADRMVFLRETHGLQILMQDGSQVRGDEKAPFLDGRYRIFLPRADVDAWVKAGVPGFTSDTASAIAPTPGAPAPKDATPTPPQSAPSQTPVPQQPSAPPEPHKD